MAETRQTMGTMMLYILWTIVIMADVVHCFCPVGCLCDDETLQVTCDDVNLEVIPITLNPSVQRLVLRRNKIRSIDTALRFYTELTFADFSNNKLVTIQNRSFEGQKKLTQLLLDHNKISSISNRTWIGLRDLSILSLRDNFLQSLDENSFTSIPNIRQLDLGQNRIELLHPAAFWGLPNLRSLLLDDNRLSINQAFFPDFLHPLPFLAELSLATNSFDILPDAIFSALPRLGILDLSGCSIRNISSQAFRNLTQLRNLKLHDNSLTEVPSIAWNALPHLELLTLGQNLFSSIQDQAFSGLDKLQILEINAARLLTEIHPRALDSNLDLQILRINNCKDLSRLPPQLLTHLPALKQLSLKDNSISEIPEDLADWSQLNHVDLSGNPLSCSCGLKWLRDAVSRTQPDHPESLQSRSGPDPVPRISLVNDLICSSPLAVSNQELGGLTDEQLGCRNPFSAPSLILAAASGCSLILILVAVAMWRYRRSLARICGTSKTKTTQKNPDLSKRHLDKWKAASPVWGMRTNSVSLIGNREPMEFHKSCPPEEECFMRAVSLHNGLKTFPRTEL